VNPLCLTKDDLKTGRLVELLPGRHIDVAMHWQYARLGARLLDVLTQEVVKAAGKGWLVPSRRVVPEHLSAAYNGSGAEGFLFSPIAGMSFGGYIPLRDRLRGH
jgi:hypothetical protein